MILQSGVYTNCASTLNTLYLYSYCTVMNKKKEGCYWSRGVFVGASQVIVQKQKCMTSFNEWNWIIFCGENVCCTAIHMICPLSTIIYQKRPVNVAVYLNCKNLPILPLPVNATTALHQHCSMFFQCCSCDCYLIFRLHWSRCLALSPIQKVTLIPEGKKLALFLKPRLSPPRFTQRIGCASPAPEILHQPQSTP